MARRKLCSCANGHLSGCLYRNQVVSYGIDFSALVEMLKEKEERVLEEHSNPSGKRKTRIFVAPVLKKVKKRKN